MNSSSPLSPAQLKLAEVFGMYKHDATPLEAELWTRLIEVHGDEAILRFLSHHVLSSSFVPRPSDAHKALETGAADSQAAFSLVVAAVRKVGPYGTPTELNRHPAVVAAVEQMGGWAMVCAALPDTSRSFELQAYQKQFDAAFRLGSSRVAIQGLAPAPLVGFVAAARAAALSASVPATAGHQQPEHLCASGERQSQSLRHGGD